MPQLEYEGAKRPAPLNLTFIKNACRHSHCGSLNDVSMERLKGYIPIHMVYAALNIQYTSPSVFCRCGHELRRSIGSGAVVPEAVLKIVQSSCQLSSSLNAYEARGAAACNE